MGSNPENEMFNVDSMSRAGPSCNKAFDVDVDVDRLQPDGIYSPSTSLVRSMARAPSAAPFWVLGLLNNTTFVIMIASAKSISEGGTALVFISSVLPGLFVKLSAPFWFDRVSYRIRLGVGSALMAACFLVVGVFSGRNVAMELFGVALCSLQGSLGEASLLALAGKLDSRCEAFNTGEEPREDPGGETRKRKKGIYITAFSSGTGLAGVAGFAYKLFLTEFLGLSLRSTLFLAVANAFLYFWAYWAYLDSHVQMVYQYTGVELTGHQTQVRQDGSFQNPTSNSYDEVLETAPYEGDQDGWENEFEAPSRNLRCCGSASIHSLEGLDIPSLTALERLKLSTMFWPYMIPLFLVYAAEYALQSGTWTAIGFPVDSVQARDRFYELSNWTYQAGVFVSRSSGTIYQASMQVFWLMPILQCLNLVLFSYIAASHIWYNYSLLILCFYVGLLGGGVYVNGYLRINEDLPKSIREFALSTVSVADTFGVICADVVGLFIQSCLYQKNALDGAVVQCPLG